MQARGRAQSFLIEQPIKRRLIVQPLDFNAGSAMMALIK
jgi:hypothetical protein